MQRYEKSATQVQSDISALSATIASIQSNLGDSVDAALADGLSDINAVIADLQAQIDNIATGEDVDDINETLDGLEEDLEELLTSNNVYSDPVNIYNVATLDFADALGDRLNIVNGAINIYAIPEMDSVKLQTVVDRIKVVVGDFNYFARNSTIATVKFDSLSGVSNLIVGAPHDLSFSNLASAGKITLGTNYDNRVKAVDFGALATASSIGMGVVSFAGTTVTAATSKANTIEYTNADNIDLGVLPYYSPGSLSITLDSGGTLDIASLDDVDSTGDQDDLDLTIVGANMVHLPNYDDGKFSATDVGTVNLPKWTGDSGTLTLSQVVNVTLGAVEVDVIIGSSLSSDNDLETLDVTAAKGTDATDKAPVVKVWSTSLETAKVAGVTGDVLFQNSPSLLSVDLSSNSVGTITLDNNANLIDVSLTGEAAGVVVTNNADLESLEIGTTTVKSSATDAKLDGAITVTDNASLVNLTVGSDNIETLTITGNDDLTNIDLSALTAIGETGKPIVKIYDNDLTASKVTDEGDGATDVANGQAGDLGKVSTNSGMDTAKAYLGVVAADADSTAEVYFDTVDVFTSEANVDTSNHAYVAGAASQLDQIKVLVKSPNTAAASKNATKAKSAWVLSSINAGNEIQITLNGTNIFANGGQTYGPGGLTLTGNNALDMAAILNAQHVTNANAAGATLAASLGGQSSAIVSLTWHTSGTSSAVIGERHTSASASTGASSSTNHGFGDDEVITFKVGANTVTTTVTGGVTAGTLATAATAIATAYAAKYGATGTASASAVASVTAAAGVLTVNGLDLGSRGHNLLVSLSVTAGTTTATNGLALDWQIGPTISTIDNSTDSNNIIITLESTVAGTIANAEDKVTGNVVIAASGSVTTTILASTQLVNSTDPNAGTYTAQTEARADVRLPEAAVTAGTSTAVDFSRVGWL